jgi:hypothetical protein
LFEGFRTSSRACGLRWGSDIQNIQRPDERYALPNHDLSTTRGSYTHNIRDFVAVDNTALNVVCNQEYAQVVPHVRRSHTFLLPASYYQQVHYHIIPAPRFSTLPTGLGPREPDQNLRLPPTEKDMHRQEYESRDELDEDDAHALVERIKAHL